MSRESTCCWPVADDDSRDEGVAVDLIVVELFIEDGVALDWALESMLLLALDLVDLLKRLLPSDIEEGVDDFAGDGDPSLRIEEGVDIEDTEGGGIRTSSPSSCAAFLPVLDFLFEPLKNLESIDSGVEMAGEETAGGVF